MSQNDVAWDGARRRVPAASLLVTAALLLSPTVLAESDETAVEERIARLHSHKCETSTSRDARYLIREYLEPKITSMRYAYPPHCPLDLAQDRYRLLEASKHRVRNNYFRCTICNKVFKTEDFLDNHLLSRHTDEIFASTSSETCVADACDALHCDTLLVDAYGYHRVDTRRHFKCEKGLEAARRAQCSILANSCFPPENGRDAAHLNNFFNEQFCVAHSCDARERGMLFSRGRLRRHVSALWVIGLVFTLIGVLAVYGFLYAYYSSVGLGAQGDLRRLGEGGWRGLLKRAFVRKTHTF